MKNCYIISIRLYNCFLKFSIFKTLRILSRITKRNRSFFYFKDIVFSLCMRHKPSKPIFQKHADIYALFRPNIYKFLSLEIRRFTILSFIK